MALSREQFQQLREKGLSVDQILAFESGKTPQTLKVEKGKKAITDGNSFTEEQPKSFLGKARDFAVDLVGGKYLAEGIGKAFGAKGVREDIGATQDAVYQRQQALVSELKKTVAEGKDTSKIKQQLSQEEVNAAGLSDAQLDYADSMPSNKQVIGSSARLATTLASGAIGRGAGAITSRILGAAPATTFLGGALSGGMTGALSGGAIGGLQGAGVGAEQNMGALGITGSAGVGAVGGAVTGGVLGAIGGGILGKLRGKTDERTLLQNVTPKADQLTPDSYEKLMNKGRIAPRTATEPSRILLSDKERQTALKFKEVISNNPVQTAININDKIGSLDDEVGKFLEVQGGKFNPDKLKTVLSEALDDIDDITLDEGRLSKAKEMLVNNFVKSIDGDETKSLWLARKEYDQMIDRAFHGAPSTGKAIKIALRNAVQDFIAQNTPDTVYASKMKDMSGLFQLRDLVGVIAKKERGLSGIWHWAKANPLKAEAAGAALLFGAGTLGLRAMRSGSNASHD